MTWKTLKVKMSCHKASDFEPEAISGGLSGLLLCVIVIQKTPLFDLEV